MSDVIRKAYEIQAEFGLTNEGHLVYTCRTTTWVPREWYGKTIGTEEWTSTEVLTEQLRKDLKKEQGTG